MSNGWAVRSNGLPYFAMAQAGVDPPDAPFVNTPCSMRLQFSLQSAPQQNASPDEIHPLFSYHETVGQVAGDLLLVGVTPNGRVAATNRLQTVVRTSAGRVVDTAWHTVLVQYDWFAGGWTLAVDGDVPITASDVGTTPLTPAPDCIGQFMLFNGRLGLTRCACSIRLAEFNDGTVGYATWRLDEGVGLAANLTKPAGQFAAMDGTLRAGVYAPGGAPAWGAVPLAPTLADYFNWRLATEYTRIPAPSTAYFGRSVV